VACSSVTWGQLDLFKDLCLAFLGEEIKTFLSLGLIKSHSQSHIHGLFPVLCTQQYVFTLDGENINYLQSS
jgi:hypothetical protein